MPQKKPDLNRVDELLSDCQSPEEILGESGLLKQLTKRLVERALAGELNHHLKDADDNDRPEQPQRPLVQDHPVGAAK